MPQARKTRKKTADASQADPIVTAPSQTVFASRAHIDSLGLEPDTAEQQLQDAALVYEQVHTSPWLTQDALVRWAAQQWPEETAVDRLNAATALLARTGRIVRLG